VVGYARAITAVTLLSVFLCGCGKANDQTPTTHSDDATPVAAVRDGGAVSPQTAASSVPGSTNATMQAITPFNTTLGLSPAFQSVVGPDQGNTSSQGIVELPDGTTFEGEVRDGRPNGPGVLTDLNGTHQEGEWRNGDVYKVTGTLVYPDGTKEIGTWNANGFKSGGTIVWKDGRQYKGDWKLSENAPEQPDGEGEMTWPDGRKYVGQFHNGTMDGSGKMTYPDGRVEDGSWKAGKFTGHP
jgi:hypothetical protein